MVPTVGGRVEGHCGTHCTRTLERISSIAPLSLVGRVVVDSTYTVISGAEAEDIDARITVAIKTYAHINAKRRIEYAGQRSTGSRACCRHLDGRQVGIRNRFIPDGMGKGSSLDTFGHYGQRNSMVWADKRTGLIVVFLCNRFLSSLDNKIRLQEISDAVWDAIN